MAWRPTDYLIKGELDNTIPGKITGWMKFKGRGMVEFELKGDFHRDIRGTKIILRGDTAADLSDAKGYMRGFSRHQRGKAGDITAGLPPQDYVSYPYIEWYGEDNGRVVVELNPEQITVIGNPIPHDKCKPNSREVRLRVWRGSLQVLRVI